MLLVYIGIVILVYMQFGAGTDLRRNKNVCIALTFFLFIISAMKAIQSGTDLAGYSASFETLKSWTYRDIFRQWLEAETLKDGMFYVVAKFAGQLGFNDYGWMALISLTFAAGAGWFIYRNSAKPVLSLLFLMTLEYYRFTFTGLRQTMAIAIVMMISYHHILDRKPIRFILSVLVASTFHSSALLFLPAYIIASWKIGWKQIALVGGLFAIYFFAPGLVRQLLSDIAWNESVASYAEQTTELTWSGFIIQGCILLFCFFFRNETTLTPYLKWRRVDAFINCMIVGLCFQVLATMIAEAFRMAYYYNICCIAVIPNLVVENKRETNHSTMYLLLAACLVAYMLWSKAYSNLTFFWQV